MMNVQETVVLDRDTEAIMIPAGNKVVIQEGAEVGIVQSLGGSFTVTVQGHMLRIDGKDADALGKEPPPRPELPENASAEDIEQAVWDQLKTVFDPEIPINIVDLGLVYDCDLHRLEDGNYRVDIDMTLTAPGCGMGDVIAADARGKVLAVPRVEQAEVEIVFDPPWDRSMMSDEARLATGMF